MGEYKHGHARVGTSDRTYITWRAIRQRCYDVNQSNYKRYGGRGIQVCVRWWKFENFLADMGEKPIGMTIERIDNDLHYMPGNCRWATPEEQRKNKRPNRLLSLATLNGETKSLREWDKIMGFKPRTLRHRRRMGWKDEDLLRPKYWRWRKK